MCVILSSQVLQSYIGGCYPTDEGNILTKGEQHAGYITEHLTIYLLYHYHMNNISPRQSSQTNTGKQTRVINP